MPVDQRAASWEDCRHASGAKQASALAALRRVAIGVSALVMVVGVAPGARAKPSQLGARLEQGRCRAGAIVVAGGCTSVGAVRRQVAAIARRALAELGLRAVILRVAVGGRPLVTIALGNSMIGVPANPRMHFRIGSMAIPYLTNLLLQLQDDGRLSIHDKLSKWFPHLPNAKRITLEMLANNTSGYPDWIQGNPVFVDALFADVFRQWTPDELLAFAFDRPLACAPGTCFNYAHTNYVILSKVLRAVTGKPVASLMRKRIFAPLGLRETEISRLPAIPEPVLHAYTSERGPYEDSTFWSPSWTIGDGTVMTSTIGDMTRTAQTIGEGRLLSRRARRQQFAPSTLGLPGMSRRLYYALGLVVTGGWRLQNPMLNGYTGVMAYLPPRKLSVVVVTSTGERASLDDINYSTLIFSRIAQYLAPDHRILPP
jgi:CubicO group peptidase (beta-lactamase class C family)